MESMAGLFICIFFMVLERSGDHLSENINIDIFQLFKGTNKPWLTCVYQIV